MSEANRIDEGAEISVSEALTKLDEVVSLLEKWNRQPRLLNEVRSLREKLERLLTTLKNRPQRQSGDIP